MKERPILMCKEMVIATLEDRKNQTRRIAKFKAYDPGLNLDWSGLEAGYYCTDVPSSGFVLRARRGDGCWEDKTYPLHCPYGQPGDRLWIKEAFSWVTLAEQDPWDKGVFSAIKRVPSNSSHNHAGCKVGMIYRATDTDWEGNAPWKPSIFMPRWASRILLEVVNVRVERVQDISEEDAKNEGVQVVTVNIPHDALGFKMGDELEYYRDVYTWLWDKLNAKRDYAWESNPWVWVIEFKKVEG